VIRILESALSCGSDVLGVSTFSGLASTTSVTASGSYRIYAVATTETTEGTSGARYRLCWSHSPGANTHFSFDVGVFTLNGPLTMTSDCPMTTPCIVQVTGIGFAATNQAKVVASGVTCTTAAAVPTVYGRQLRRGGRGDSLPAV
jgi:hypothetical protein